MSDSQWITTGTPENFEQDVIERSKTMPVVVDFWATWCQPCRMLAPLLEKLAEEYDGKFQLVKINTEEAPELAAAFRVQSIPYVVALRDGQIVDQFTGLLDEPQLHEWLKGIVPGPADELLVEADAAFQARDLAAAESALLRVLELDEGLAAAKIKLAAVRLAQGDSAACATILAELEARGFLEPEAQQVKAQMELQEGASAAGGLEEARAAAESDPDNSELQIGLADALAISGNHAEACGILLDVVRKDRDGAGEAAKDSLVKIFNMANIDPAIVSENRRKLATLLY